jgi:hypothetical protein
MGRFAKRVFAGVAAACFLAVGGAFAQTNVVDDLEHGGNMNNWGGYWYFVATEGAKIRPCDGPDDGGCAGPGDAYGPMSFVPSASGGRGGGSGSAAAVLEVAELPPHFDDAKAYDGWAESYPQIAMATMLTQDTTEGMGAGFNTATAIKFHARADGGPINIIFKVETVENASAQAKCYDKASKGEWDENGNVVITAGSAAAAGGAKELDKDANTWSKYRPEPTLEPCATLTGLSNPPTFPVSKVHTYNAYYKIDTVTTTWKEYTVKIADVTSGVSEGAKIQKAGAAFEGDFVTAYKAGDIAQEGYWGTQYAFKKSKATRLSWYIPAKLNPGLGAGAKLFVDEISVEGYTHIPKDLCYADCGKALDVPAGANLFSDFDNIVGAAKELRQNSLGQYWYYYTDKDAGGTSAVDEEYLDDGTIDSKGTPGKVLKLEAFKSGDYAYTSNAAAIGVTFGPAFPDERSGVNVNAFTGIGTNLYDPEAETPSYYDAIENDLQGIYFEYLTDGATQSIFVEVEDATSVAANNGEVYYLKLNGTGNTWKSATIKVDKLVLPFWAERTAPLDRTKLAKIQFKIQGAANKFGVVAIDNVYLLDKNSVGVRFANSKVTSASGLRATYSRSGVSVKWNASTPLASGKIQLVNTKGRVVASAPIAKTAGSNISANLGTSRVSTGMYFVRVNAKDINGRKVVQQVPVSVVK